jgi:DNA-3-methyladenine glycosylase II
VDGGAFAAVDAVKHLKLVDPRLGMIIESVGKYTIDKEPEPFRSFVEAIIYQQLAGSAADTIFRRFLKIYGGRFPSPRRIASTSSAELRAAGLSRQKIEYVRDLASRVSDKRLDLRRISELDDEEVVAELTQVKGIGRWTADMFLIFCLGKPDVLPVGDLGLRRAIKLTYELSDLPRPSEMHKLASVWKPYRSVATWYLWKSLAKFKGIG